MMDNGERELADDPHPEDPMSLQRAMAGTLVSIDGKLTALPDYKAIVNEERRRRKWVVGILAIAVTLAMIGVGVGLYAIANGIDHDHATRNDGRCINRILRAEDHASTIKWARDTFGNSPKIDDLELRYKLSDERYARLFPADCRKAPQ